MIEKEKLNSYKKIQKNSGSYFDDFPFHCPISETRKVANVIPSQISANSLTLCQLTSKTFNSLPKIKNLPTNVLGGRTLSEMTYDAKMTCTRMHEQDSSSM